MLSPAIQEFIRQKTLYKMKQQLWSQFQKEWDQFLDQNDHLKFKVPIPPCTRTLLLHAFLKLNQGLNLQQLTLSSVLANR